MSDSDSSAHEVEEGRGGDGRGEAGGTGPAGTTLRFSLEKETKNTVRFSEVPGTGAPPIVGTIYVQKWFFRGSPPETLRVTLHGS